MIPVPSYMISSDLILKLGMALRWLEPENSAIACWSYNRSSLWSQRWPIAFRETHGLSTNSNMALKVGNSSSGSSWWDSRTIFAINRIGSKHLVLDICEFVHCLRCQPPCMGGTYSLADYWCSCEFEESYYSCILSYLIGFVYLWTVFRWETFGI